MLLEEISKEMKWQQMGKVDANVKNIWSFQGLVTMIEETSHQFATIYKGNNFSNLKKYLLSIPRF